MMRSVPAIMMLVGAVMATAGLVGCESKSDSGPASTASGSTAKKDSTATKPKPPERDPG